MSTYPSFPNSATSSPNVFFGTIGGSPAPTSAAAPIVQPTIVTVSTPITLTGDVTGSGTGAIATTLANTAVTAGNYTYASISVDSKGRITAAGNGLPPAAYTPPSTTLTGDIVGTGTGTVPTILADSGVSAGSYTNASISVDSKGRITSASNSAAQIITLSGDVTGAGSGAVLTTLVNSGVAAGTYNNVAVNTKGIVISGSNITYLTNNQVITASGDVTGAGATNIVLTLADTLVTPGSYTYATILVDSKGRITYASNGTAPVVSQPNTQVVYGTGTNLASSPGLTYVSSTGTLAIAGTTSSRVYSTQSMQIASDISITLTTNGINSVMLNANGSLSIGGTAGTSGQVLVSNGVSTSPTWQTVASGFVTSVSVNGTTGRIVSSGSPITSTGAITVDLATTAVTAGSYTYSNITVDAYGRITSANSGTTPSSTATNIAGGVTGSLLYQANTNITSMINPASNGYILTLVNGIPAWAANSGVTGAPVSSPIVDFTSDVRSGTPTFSVTFSDLTTGSPTSWLWNFGDGGTSTARNPVHQYTTAGAYDVKLTATNSSGANSMIKSSWVSSTSVPVAYSYPGPAMYYPRIDIPFTWDIRARVANGTNIYWDVWNWQNLSTQNLTYMYIVGANFGIAPINNGMGTATISVNVAVSGSEPLLVLRLYSDAARTISLGTSAYSGPMQIFRANHIVPETHIPDFLISSASGPAPYSVTFTDTSLGSVPLAWSWEFGDGFTDVQQNPTHVYSTPGVYSVQLTTNFTGYGIRSIFKPQIITVT